MTSAIGIMCKAPQSGRSKTRLAATIGQRAAAELSGCFLRDIAATVNSVSIAFGGRGYAVYAPAGTEDALRGLIPAGFGLLLQAGENFGDVLRGAVGRLLRAGHGEVLLVNGDSPTLPAAFLVQAINHLREAGDRVVLGPASDGGYYLIGLKSPHAHLFSQIDWGTDSVFSRTCARANAIGLHVALLPEWYDVDDDTTLAWLNDELAGRSQRFRGGADAPASRTYLAAMPVVSQ